MAKLCKDLDEFWERKEVGDWCFDRDDRYLIIRLHGGEMDGVAAILIKPDPDIPNKNPWQWDGNREAPTLTPSILHHSNPPWHGWMTNGKLVLA